MSAVLVSRIKVRDAEQMKAYGAASAPTVAAHSGEVIARGNFAEALLGAGAPHATGVIRFPDLAAARAWFASPEYQALADLREAAGEMEFFVYEAL